MNKFNHKMNINMNIKMNINIMFLENFQFDSDLYNNMIN